MASCIIGGMIAHQYPAERIFATATSDRNLGPLQREYGIQVSTDNLAFVANSHIVVLAVKPQLIQSVCEQLREQLQQQPETLIMSLAAGTPSESIRHWLGYDAPIVRCMPNTPSKVGEGASGLFANNAVTDVQRQQAEMILEAVGMVRWVGEESQIDTVIAVAGSAPAYFFLFIESIIEAGVAQGFDRETASAMAIQTAYGAAKLAKESDLDVVELRRQVTSPKGTTEQAIVSFENSGLREIVAKAMSACRARAEELARDMTITPDK